MVEGEKRIKYEGMIYDEKLTKGKIEIKYNEEDSYKGDYNQCMREGEGTLIESGTYYHGKFSNNMKNGEGTLMFKDGSRYDG